MSTPLADDDAPLGGAFDRRIAAGDRQIRRYHCPEREGDAVPGLDLGCFSDGQAVVARTAVERHRERPGEGFEVLVQVDLVVAIAAVEGQTEVAGICPQRSVEDDAVGARSA